NDYVLPELLWPAVLGQVVLGIGGGLVLVLVAPLLAEQILHVHPSIRAEAIAAFRIVGLSLPVVLMSISFRGMLEAAQRFDLAVGIKTTSSMATFLVPLGGVLVGWDLAVMLTVLLVVRVILFGLLVLATLRTLPVVGSHFRMSDSALRRLFTFGGWVATAGLASLALSHADRLIIGNMLGVAAVGYYSIPQEIIGRLGAISGGLAGVLYPAFSAFQGRQDAARLRELFGRAMKYMLLFSVLIFGLAAALASDVLRLWVGQSVAQQSAPILRLLAIGAAAQFVGVVPYALVQGGGRPDVAAKMHLIGVPLYPLLLWWTVGTKGTEGAAVLWSTRAALEGFYLFWVAEHLNRWLRAVTLETLRSNLLSILMLLGAFYVIQVLPGSAALRGVLTSLVALVFVWRACAGALGVEERRAMFRLASGLRRAIGTSQEE
ncbi:MAG: oligosaccharide flippase family protein, partial [candidate division KSB1 bacterium]|nr:oligosaccharide flippase family protein [candidate division KSB1 bacterium]